MEEEAKEFIQKHQFSEISPDWNIKVPQKTYASDMYENISLRLILNGTYGENHQYIGTNGAIISTFLALETIKADLIVNIGTCGAWKAHDSYIGDVYWVNQTSFHDRRIPLAQYEDFGQQKLRAFEIPDDLKDTFKVASLSTGNSLDITKRDQEIISMNKAILKDMEGAAINEIASLNQTPLILVKAVTDLIDSEIETSEEFLKNLKYTISELNKKMQILINYLDQKWTI